MHSKKIARLCLDEAHVLFLDTCYRKSLLSVKKVIGYDFPKIFVTGTLPPELLQVFLDATGLNPLTHIIRAPTSRPELAYRLIPSRSNAEVKDAAVALAYYLQYHSFTSRSRGIIYVNSTMEVEILAERLDCLFYHAKMELKDRTLSHNRWKTGATPSEQWIVATSAFSHGIDQPYVEATIFAGRFFDFIKFAQASARGGRKDSVRCDVVMFYTPQKVTVPKPDHALAGEFNKWLLNKTDCRRIGISKAFDGSNHMVTCSTLPHAELCDICDQSSDTSGIQKAVAYATSDDVKLLPLSDPGTEQSDIYDQFLDNHPISASVLKQLEEIENQERVTKGTSNKRTASLEDLPPAKRQAIQEPSSGSSQSTGQSNVSS